MSILAAASKSNKVCTTNLLFIAPNMLNKKNDEKIDPQIFKSQTASEALKLYSLKRNRSKNKNE